MLDTLRYGLTAFRDAIGNHVYRRYITGHGSNKLSVGLTPGLPLYIEGTHTIKLNLSFGPSSRESHIQVLHELGHALIYQMYGRTKSEDPASTRYARDMGWKQDDQDPNVWYSHPTNSTARGRYDNEPEEDLVEALAIYIYDKGKGGNLSLRQHDWVGSFVWTLKNGLPRWWEGSRSGPRRPK